MSATRDQSPESHSVADPVVAGLHFQSCGLSSPEAQYGSLLQTASNKHDTGFVSVQSTVRQAFRMAYRFELKLAILGIGFCAGIGDVVTPDVGRPMEKNCLYLESDGDIFTHSGQLLASAHAFGLLLIDLASPPVCSHAPAL